MYFSVLLCQFVADVNGNDENRLVKQLLSNYERFGGKHARGVASPTSVLNVTHGLTINDLEIDVAKGTIAVYVWENMVGDIVFETCSSGFS